MRYFFLLLTAFLLCTSAQTASASLHKTAGTTYARATVVQRPIITFRARFEKVVDRITATILKLAPPAFRPSPGDENLDAPMNKMANVAFYSGIGGYLLFPALLPVALVTGIIALNQIRDSGERGKSQAIAGIIMGGAPIAVAIIVFSWINGQ